jgi:adenosylhomocysteine nucleosidase
MKILVVAALKREFAPLARKKLAGVECLATGEGRANAEGVLSARLDKENAEAVICLGLAGALSPSLRIGDLVVDKGKWLGADVLAAAAPLTVHLGKIITIDEIVGARGKRELAAGLATGEIACVDMESAAVMKICDQRRIPFLLVRVVSDLADEDLPLDFNACRDASGRISNAKVLRAVAQKPQALKGLLELNRRAGLGAENLAVFVERLLAKHLQRVREKC